MAEHTPEKRGVTGSTPVSTTVREPFEAAAAVRRVRLWAVLLASVACLAITATDDRVAAQSAGNGLADGSLRALERIIDVEAQLDSTSGVMATIGRWGSDVERDHDQARSQFQQGDSEASLTTLDSAEQHIDGLVAAGRLRIAIAGVVVFAPLRALFSIRLLRWTTEPDNETDAQGPNPVTV